MAIQRSERHTQCSACLRAFTPCPGACMSMGVPCGSDSARVGCRLRLVGPADTQPARHTGGSHATDARHYSCSCPHSPGVPGGGRCRRGGSGWVVAFSSPRPEGRSAPRAASGRHRQRQSVSQPRRGRPRSGRHDLRRAGSVRPRHAAHPELAESWTIPDDRTYVFKLRRGVTFHNGRPATAEDVKWSIEKIYEVGAKGQWANYIAGIAKIDVLDAATVKFTMEKPNAVLLNGLPVAAIIPRESYETIDTNPVGLGPYRFVERIPGQYLRVAKSEKYWDQSTNYPDQITFSFATEESTQVANLQSGIVDMHGWLPISRVAELRQNPRFRLHDTGEGTLGWLGVLLNTARSPLDNKKLRQAIAHGIDKAAIHKSVFAGLGTPDNGYLPTGHWAHVPDAELGGYRFDPARAKALLAEAGHPNGIELTWSIGTLLPEFTRYAELAQGTSRRSGSGSSSGRWSGRPTYRRSRASAISTWRRTGSAAARTPTCSSASHSARPRRATRCDGRHRVPRSCSSWGVAPRTRPGASSTTRSSRGSSSRTCRRFASVAFRPCGSRAEGHRHPGQRRGPHPVAQAQRVRLS